MTGKTILCVEDNDDNVYVLRGRLERMGFNVRVANDGSQGVSMAREVLPDLIIMDLILPELDGWEATKQLRADHTTRSIPIIALSSSAMPEDRQRALDAGCDRFDSKPVDFTRLRSMIDELLG
jgi:CheY-like chemotaxis protein